MQFIAGGKRGGEGKKTVLFGSIVAYFRANDRPNQKVKTSDQQFTRARTHTHTREREREREHVTICDMFEQESQQQEKLLLTSSKAERNERIMYHRVQRNRSI